MRLTPGTVAFACHEKACAPPPAGKGGSSGAGGKTVHRGLLPLTAIRTSMKYLADRAPGSQAKLEADIAKNGVLKPIKVRYEEVHGKPAYYVTDGHHRLAAAKAAGIARISVEVESRIGTPPHFAPKPNVGEIANRWFMGPANAKGRQHGVVVSKEVADAWKAANPPKPQDSKRVVTKYY